MNDYTKERLYKTECFGGIVQATCGYCSRPLEASMDMHYSTKYRRVFCSYKCAETYCLADVNIVKLHPSDFKEIRLRVFNDATHEI